MAVETVCSPVAYFPEAAGFSFFRGFRLQYGATSVPFLILCPLTQVQEVLSLQADSGSSLQGEEAAITIEVATRQVNTQAQKNLNIIHL
jgi:hypothetical protein